MWTLLVFATLISGLVVTFYKVKNKRCVIQAAVAILWFLCLGAVVGSLLLAQQLVKISYDSDQTPRNSSVSEYDLVSTVDCSTAWIYNRPLTDNLLENIKHLQNEEVCVSVHVYCGTSQCVQAVSELNNPSITSEFLVISDLVKVAPLEKWFARHPLYKVYGWLNFEDHLQRAVQLGILWKYGGIYVDPRIRIIETNTTFKDSTACHNGWTSSSTSLRTALDVSCFPKHHQFIKNISEVFTEEYKQGVVGEGSNSKFFFNFDDVYEKALHQCKISDEMCPNSVALKCVSEDQDESSFKRHHFGTLSYYLHVSHTHGDNLGDEIQACSGLQFLPFVDILLERDRMYGMQEKQEPVTAFLNAWYGAGGANWPLPSNLHPFMVSIHAHKGTKQLWMRQDNVDYFKQHEPIGCRDSSTVDFLESLHVTAYLSGCMTLMLKNPNGTRREDKIIITDVLRDKSLIPEEIRNKATYLYHFRSYNANTLTQFTNAYNLLEHYSTAKLVITQRIHCALPCVGMGIPVIFISSVSLPGDSGESNKELSPRLRGLTPLLHMVDLYKMSREEAAEWLKNFDYDNPPPNPNPGMMMRMRTTFWNVMRENQDIRDAAYKFGMVPLQPPPVLASEREQHEKLLFHLVFTESTFMWHHWRTVESIFHHHPFAKVTIHSNTLQQSEFDVLMEGGYSIKVESYSLADLLKDTPAEGFFSKLSSDSNLLGLLVLYKWGGIYMGNDMIVVNPLDKLPKNLLTWEDINNHSISGSFIALEKNSDFLKACLAAIVKNNDESSVSRSVVLTNAWEQLENQEGVVTMNSNLFTEREMVDDCLSASSSVEEILKFLKEEAYTVRLNLNILDDIEKEAHFTRLSKGTVCKYVLNSFCILCNNQY